MTVDFYDQIFPGEDKQFPAGYLPRYPTLAPFNVLGWIAWRTASWQRIRGASLKRDDQAAHIGRAHLSLIEAALLGKVSVFGVRFESGTPGRVQFWQEPALLRAAVFSGPVSINFDGSLTVACQQSVLQPDLSMRYEVKQMLIYENLCFVTAEIGDIWPGKAVAAQVTKKGQGRYVQKDEPLVAEMLHILQSKKAETIWEAANIVAPRAMGSNSQLDSKAKRLMARFRKSHPESF